VQSLSNPYGPKGPTALREPSWPHPRPRSRAGKRAARGARDCWCARRRRAKQVVLELGLETEVASRTGGMRLQKGGHPMTRILRLTVKAALALAAGCSLYLASHYSDGRSVPRWTTAVSPAGPIVERTSVLVRAVAPLEQRVRAEPGSCASQTWPNIARECITGRAEGAKVRTTTLRDPSSTDIAPGQVSPATLAANPESTGSLPVAASPSLAQDAAQDVPRAEIRKVKKHGLAARGERRRVREARHRGSLRSHVVRERATSSAYATRAHEPIQFRLADRGN